jgi:hypothetical protein
MNDTVINLQDFKDGIADGLLNGNRKDGRLSDAYKQGYDFGLYLYNEQLEKEEHE